MAVFKNETIRSYIVEAEKTAEHNAAMILATAVH